jgi:hypothetical protein
MTAHFLFLLHPVPRNKFIPSANLLSSLPIWGYFRMMTDVI